MCKSGSQWQWLVTYVGRIDPKGPTGWGPQWTEHIRKQLNICPWRETKQGFLIYLPKYTASHPRRQYCAQLPPWYKTLFDKWQSSQNWRRTAAEYGQILVAKRAIRHTDEDFKPPPSPGHPSQEKSSESGKVFSSGTISGWAFKLDDGKKFNFRNFVLARNHQEERQCKYTSYLN